MDVFLPAELVSRPLEMRIRVGRAALPPVVFEKPGRQTITRSIPDSGEIVEFELDRALAPDDQDRRERGIIVLAIRFD